MKKTFISFSSIPLPINQAVFPKCEEERPFHLHHPPEYMKNTFISFRSISLSINRAVFPKCEEERLFREQMDRWPPNMIRTHLETGPPIWFSPGEVLAPFYITQNTLPLSGKEGQLRS